MTDATHHDTINWDDFWREADEDERAGATPASHETPRHLAEFVAERGVPNATADVGCGPGHVAFHLAEQFPATTVVGYDAATSVLAENRRRADSEDVDNVRFERAVLPAFDPDRSFDLVVCYATLHYIGEPEAALANLYDAVAPGGSLVFNYPNRFTSRRYRGIVADPPVGEGVREVDPQQFARRFRLVIEEENLLSYERIHDTLGTWPQSVWPVIGESAGSWPSRVTPLVFVPK